MRKTFILLALLAGIGCSWSPDAGQTPEAQTNTVPDSVSWKAVADVPLPPGYARVPLPDGSFGAYLRSFSLRQQDNTVRLYNGQAASRQDGHVAILDIDVGDRDLQQCADAVMRLRAEYLYARQQHAQIRFRLANGKELDWLAYAGNDRSYKRFRKYLVQVFAYANTASLRQQLTPASLQGLMPGDVFVQAGNPFGHAVIVMDVAVHGQTGKRLFLLAQSYMPAQDIHLLRNPRNPDFSPWYDAAFGERLDTPSWQFVAEDLRRFP